MDTRTHQDAQKKESGEPLGRDGDAEELPLLLHGALLELLVGQLHEHGARNTAADTRDGAEQTEEPEVRLVGRRGRRRGVRHLWRRYGYFRYFNL